MAVIEINQLKKHFGRTKAVDGISFSVEKGELFGFLGPNGAGKTTTIRCLMDFIRPTEGSATILGLDTQRDSAPLKKKIGYLSPEVPAYDTWTGEQHFRFIAKTNGTVDQAWLNQLIERLGFDPKKPSKSLSSGNRQKLGLIMALMTKPEVLILDEPTSALDPILQNTVYDILRNYAKNGATVFLSSHNLPEVERTCGRVAIIRTGKIVAVENVEALRQRQVHVITARFTKNIQASDFRYEGTEIIVLTDRQIQMKVQNDLNPVLSRLVRHGVEDLEITHASLEEIFLSYYQEEA